MSASLAIILTIIGVVGLAVFALVLITTPGDPEIKDLWFRNDWGDR